MQEVGIREFRDHLSQYLQDVREGENFTITDRGKPVAQLIPTQNELLSRSIAPLLEKGRAQWGGGKPEGTKIEVEDGPQLSEYVRQDRR